MKFIIKETQLKLLSEQSGTLSSVSTPAQGGVAQYADPNYTGDRRGGGFGGLEDLHTIMTIAQIGTAFIPFAGPFISAGIGLVEASLYYNEGDTKSAGIVGVLSMLPFMGTVISKIPGVKELGAKGMASLGSKIAKGQKKLSLIESEVLNLIKKNESLIKQELTNAGTKLSPLIKQIQTLKPSYIERFGQSEYDKLLYEFISGTKDKNMFIKTLMSSSKSNPKIANFISKFGIKFTQNELKQIHEYTSMIKNLPKVLTKGILNSINPTVNVMTKNGSKSISLKFITSEEAVKKWGEKSRTTFGAALGNKIYFIVDNIKKMSPGDLDQLFYHEFAHIKDPSNISSKLNKIYKTAERYSDEYFSKGYYFHPRELVANTAKILNGISVNLKNNIKSFGKDRSINTLDDLISWAKGTKKDFTEDMIKVLGYDQKYVKEHLDILMEKNPKEYRDLVTKIAQQSEYLKSQVKLAL